MNLKIIKNHKAEAFLVLFNFFFAAFIAFSGFSYLERTSVEGLNNRYLWDDADDCAWIIYAQKTAEDGAAPRATWFDNFGKGRPIGWSTTLMHVMAFNGKVVSAITGRSIHESIEIGAVFFNPLVYAILGTIISVFLWKFLGMIGVLIYLTWFLNFNIVYQFAPLHPDHQGVILFLNIISVGAFAIGVVKSNANLIIASILIGSFNVAMSSTTGIFSLILIALSTVAFTFLNKNKTAFLSKGWKYGAIGGGIVSFVMWIIERGDLSLFAFESNNPIHSISIFGAGLLVSAFVDFTNGEKNTNKIAIGIFSLTPILLTILVMGDLFMQTRQPTFSRLMWFIKEMQLQKTPDWTFYVPLSVVFFYLIRNFFSTKNAIQGMAFLIFSVSIFISFLSIRFEPTMMSMCIIVAIPLALSCEKVLSEKPVVLILLFSAIFSTTQTISFFQGLYSGKYDSFGRTYGQVAFEIANKVVDTDDFLIVDALPDRAMRTYYFLGKGRIGATIYWEGSDSIVETAKMLANGNTDAAEEALRAYGVNYLVIQSPIELKGLILSTHGPDALFHADFNQYAGYSGADWFTNPPEWLRKENSRFLHKINFK